MWMKWLEMDDFEETGFPCQDHLLDLVIKSAFDLSLVANMDIAMVRDVVVTIRASTQKQDVFKEIQRILGDRVLLLIRDVRTRWNSIYYMVERFVKLEIPLIVFAGEKGI
jgi:zinc finger BED domain-containing protein 1 (E3 SUMO-protein ligase ZBED1)